MATPFIGQITMFGGNFAPFGYAFCNGQLLSIAQNTALFALIGTTYGGDGQTTFGLPDLRGRVPVHQGQGPGLQSYVIGQNGGTETVTLITSQVPAHSHTLAANSNPGDSSSPANSFFAAVSSSIYSSSAPNAQMNAAAVGLAGGSQPHDNMLPFLVINFIIALQGIFPSRN
jgi:microcystin-dependent protein